MEGIERALFLRSSSLFSVTFLTFATCFFFPSLNLLLTPSLSSTSSSFRLFFLVPSTELVFEEVNGFKAPGSKKDSLQVEP